MPDECSSIQGYLFWSPTVSSGQVDHQTSANQARIPLAQGKSEGGMAHKQATTEDSGGEGLAKWSRLQALAACKGCSTIYWKVSFGLGLGLFVSLSKYFWPQLWSSSSYY